MKTLLIILFFIGLNQISLIEHSYNVNHVFIVINKKSNDTTNIYYHEVEDVTYSFSIRFEAPNYRASLIHIPKRANYELYSHEEIEVTQSQLLQSKVLYAEKLTYTDWSELQKCQEEDKVYIIFQEDYLSKDRFVLNHKFKALEAYVSTSGPE